jgi:hypothetical protein
MVTAENISDDDIREAIRWLETDIGILEAALKIKTGKLVEMMRKGAADVINARCSAEVLDARAKEKP